MTTPLTRPHTVLATDPGRQAFLLLRTVFTVAPIAFGLDKFANLLTDWPGYLAPWIDDLVPGTASRRCTPSASSRSWPASWSPSRHGSAAGWWPPGSAGSSSTC